MDAPLESDDDDALSLTLEENAEDEEGDDPILEHNDDDDDDVMLEVNGSGDDEHGEDDDDDGLSLQLEANEEVNAIEDHDAEAGIAGALRALCPTYDARAMTMGAAGEALVGSIGSLGMIVGAEGQLVDPQKEFLIPSARQKLEDAQALYPRKSGESDDSYLKRLTTLLTANEPLEAFVAAADQLIETLGRHGIAARMREVGDDHFAAGFFVSACHCYTAGIVKHEPKTDELANLVRCHVNRAAALLKLGEKEAAIADADTALSLTNGDAGTTLSHRRKALMRRAQALFELGRLEEAKLDLRQLDPAIDATAKLLLNKVLTVEHEQE